MESFAWVTRYAGGKAGLTPLRGEEKWGRRSLRSRAPKNLKPIERQYLVQPPGWYAGMIRIRVLILQLLLWRL